MIRAKRKTLAVHIDNTGQIIVKAPVNLSLAKINAFLAKKSDWIIKNQLKAKSLYQKYINLYTYSEIMYKGQILKSVFDDVKNIIIIQDKVLIPKKYQSKERYNSLKKALKKFLILNAEKEFSKRLSDFKNLGFQYNSLNIINSKTRWGICDSNKNIGLNFRAVMLPDCLIDYLILHELSHTIEFNHSKKFWKIVQTYIPDYKELKKILKNYSFLQELFR